MNHSNNNKSLRQGAGLGSGSDLGSGSTSLTRRRVILGAAGLLGLPLTACERFVPGASAPAQLYRLTPKSAFDNAVPSVDWQLVVEPPTAPAALNSTRISRMPTPTKLDYFARSNWTDRAPQMIQGLALESFSNSGRIVAVGRESVGLRPDFVLKSELREFQAEYFATATPSVRVRIDAKLVQMPRRAIVAAESFEALAPAEADRMQDIVAAFDDALGKVLQDLVQWCLVTGEAIFAVSRR